MANKPIIQIGIEDSAFKAFLSLFDGYQEQLKKMPEMWDKIGQSMAESSTRFSAASSSLESAISGIDRTAEGEAKVTKEKDKQDKTVSAIKSQYTDINKIVKNIESSIGLTTGQLAKWVGIGAAFGSGLAFAQRLWGAFGNVAQSSVELGKSAGQLGVTPGQLQAAKASYDPYIDTQSLLENIAEAKADRSKWGFFNQLGVTDFQTKSAAELLPEMMNRIQQRARHAFGPGGGGSQELQGFGVSNFVSDDTAREISGLSDKQLSNAKQEFENSAKKLDLSKEDLDKWVEFSQRMSIFESSFSNVFKQLLVGDHSGAGDSMNLAASALTNGVTDKIYDQQGSDEVNMLNTTQLRAHLDKSKSVSGKISRASGGGGSTGSNGIGAFFDGLEASNNLPSGFLSFFEGMESSFGKNTGLSKAGPKIGALGAFQMSAASRKDYGVTNPFDVHDEGKGAAKKLRDLIKEFHGNLDEVVAAWDDGQNRVKKLIRKHGSDWESYLKPETQNYIKKAHEWQAQQENRTTRVLIANNTGGDVNVNASIIAH